MTNWTGNMITLYLEFPLDTGESHCRASQSSGKDSGGKFLLSPSSFKIIFTWLIKLLFFFVFLLCSQSASLLLAPQDHLSWTGLAWRGRQKPADWGSVAQRCPNSTLWKQSDDQKARGPVQSKHGCSLSTITHWKCYLTRQQLSLLNEVNRLKSCQRVKRVSSSRLDNTWMWKPWSARRERERRKR